VLATEGLHAQPEFLGATGAESQLAQIGEELGGLIVAPGGLSRDPRVYLAPRRDFASGERVEVALAGGGGGALPARLLASRLFGFGADARGDETAAKLGAELDGARSRVDQEPGFLRFG